MDARDAAERRARQRHAVRQAHDEASIAAMDAPDRMHRSTLLRSAHDGRAALVAYLCGAFADKGEVAEVRFGTPSVGPDRAAVECWAVFRGAAPDRHSALAGSCLLRFGPEGLVVASRDDWHPEDCERRPPPAWGR